MDVALASVTHRQVNLGVIHLHLVDAGDGPLVVLLHGFPEFWYSWRHQIPPLVESGFRVIAPDMRGYNGSDRPRGIRAYRAQAVAGDIERLVAWAGVERAAVVGHDWGGAIAWQLAVQAPAVVERLGILNVPHPLSMARGLRTLRQVRKSWYIGAFQVPWMPEAVLHAGQFAVLRRILRDDPTNPNAFTPEDVRRYVEVWSRPGGLTEPINYYRALRYANLRQLRNFERPIDIPTLVIWGERDRYLGSELAEPPREVVRNVRVERLPEASHWVHLDEPATINRLLIGFLRESTGPSEGYTSMPPNVRGHTT